MSEEKKFFEITQVIFGCIKSKGEYHDPPAVYSPPNAEKGKITISTWVGKIEMTFDFDSAAQTLSYTILDKPGIVPISKIWEGFEEAVKSCRIH